LVSIVATLGAEETRTDVIELYRAWIACQGPSTPHLFAAWFNLGVEFVNVGNASGAMLALRNAHALTGCGKTPDEPQYLAVTATLCTLPVVVNLPFSAAC